MSTNPSSHVPATVSDPAPAGESSSGKITQAELEAHGTQKDMWILISGKGPSLLSGSRHPRRYPTDASIFLLYHSVYDCTSFMDEHPGGLSAQWLPSRRVPPSGACVVPCRCNELTLSSSISLRTHHQATRLSFARPVRPESSRAAFCVESLLSEGCIACEAHRSTFSSVPLPALSSFRRPSVTSRFGHLSSNKSDRCCLDSAAS